MARHTKDEEYTKFLKMLETKFIGLLLQEGWDYIVDNMIHELYMPEDIGEDESTLEWHLEYNEVEINATNALITFLETRLEQIMGCEMKIVKMPAPIRIEDI